MTNSHRFAGHLKALFSLAPPPTYFPRRPGIPELEGRKRSSAYNCDPLLGFGMLPAKPCSTLPALRHSGKLVVTNTLAPLSAEATYGVHTGLHLCSLLNPFPSLRVFKYYHRVPIGNPFHYISDLVPKSRVISLKITPLLLCLAGHLTVKGNQVYRAPPQDSASNSCPGLGRAPY